MDGRLLKALVLAAVFLAGIYLVKKDREGWKTPETTAPETTEYPDATGPTITPRTTIPPSPYALPECLMMKTPCRRDRCHFGNALNRNSTLLCEQIDDPRLRGLCLDKVGENKNMEHAVIEGQVFNPADCRVYPGLTVEIRYEDGNSTIATARTNSTGEYEAEAPADGRYGVYVSVDGMTLNQNITVRGAGSYVVDFALS